MSMSSAEPVSTRKKEMAISYGGSLKGIVSIITFFSIIRKMELYLLHETTRESLFVACGVQVKDLHNLRGTKKKEEKIKCAFIRQIEKAYLSL